MPNQKPSEDVHSKLAELYSSWVERVGRDRANLMLGAFAVAMAMSDRGVSDDLVIDAFQEILLHILGIEPSDFSDFVGSVTIH